MDLLLTLSRSPARLCQADLHGRRDRALAILHVLVEPSPLELVLGAVPANVALVMGSTRGVVAMLVLWPEVLPAGRVESWRGLGVASDWRLLCFDRDVRHRYRLGFRDLNRLEFRQDIVLREVVVLKVPVNDRAVVQVVVLLANRFHCYLDVRGFVREFKPGLAKAVAQVCMPNCECLHRVVFLTAKRCDFLEEFYLAVRYALFEELGDLV